MYRTFVLLCLCTLGCSSEKDKDKKTPPVLFPTEDPDVGTPAPDGYVIRDASPRDAFRGTLGDVGPEVLCTPTEERCDTVDNDCDGVVDEDFWSQIDLECGNPLETAPGFRFGLDIRGECRNGFYRCHSSLGVPICFPSAPTNEECDQFDGLDNDCDGLIDELQDQLAVDDCPGAHLPESTGRCDPWKECRDGEVRCMQESPIAEQCNGIDDDCDGITDEEIGVEVCNGEDDDCDGIIDENPIWEVIGCVAEGGVGACMRSQWECRGGAPFCPPSEPTEEICDNIDNDCNGFTDEGLGGITICGQGACRTAANETCEEGRWTILCIPNNPEPETCNGIDDDCDSFIDEGPAMCCMENEVCEGDARRQGCGPGECNVFCSSEDGARGNCVFVGNGVIEPDEDCDDGNTDIGDGCNDQGERESRWICQGEPSQCIRSDGDRNP